MPAVVPTCARPCACPLFPLHLFSIHVAHSFPFLATSIRTVLRWIHPLLRRSRCFVSSIPRRNDASFGVSRTCPWIVWHVRRSCVLPPSIASAPRLDRGIASPWHLPSPFRRLVSACVCACSCVPVSLCRGGGGGVVGWVWQPPEWSDGRCGMVSKVVDGTSRVDRKGGGSMETRRHPSFLPSVEKVGETQTVDADT